MVRSGSGNGAGRSRSARAAYFRYGRTDLLDQEVDVARDATTIINVRGFPRSLLIELKVHAARQQRSVKGCVIEACKQWVERQQKQKGAKR